MTQGITSTTTDGVHELRFDRAEAMNTLTLPVVAEFDQALGTAAAKGARALLITAAGRSFMAGGDLGYLTRAGDSAPAQAAQLIDAHNHAVLKLVALDCPTVVAMQGAVAGDGLSLMLACDLAIAAQDARFIFAYDRIAATPDGGVSWTLPRAVGLRQALPLWGAWPSWSVCAPTCATRSPTAFPSTRPPRCR